MANPGYPQMGQMPPGMGPPMGGPPMGGPPMGMPRPPVRQGVSKAVPVVVSAGLAVGVFCGLLFGVGTGKKDAVAAPSKGTNAKEHPVEDTTNLVQTPVKPITPTAQLGKGSGAGSAAGSGAGSAVAMAGSAAGSGAGSGSAAVAMKKLTIKVEPDAAASVAKIQIDGKPLDGTSIELPAETKSVKVSLTATGYHSIDKSIDLLGDETTVEFPMQKRSGGGSPGFGGVDTHRPTVPRRPPSETPKKKPGGLIDI
jgi:hypothetical protein